MNVLITGASAGFGKALAERLVTNGHRVIGCARRLDKLNALAETLGEAFLPVIMDVSETLLSSANNQTYLMVLIK